MQFSAVEIRFIVTTSLYSTFTNDLERKYFFFENVHSYRVCSFKLPIVFKTFILSILGGRFKQVLLYF